MHAGTRISLAVVLAGWSLAQTSTPVAWPDTPATRQEAAAVIQTLNAELLNSRSATATLEHWCRDRHLADNPTIVAERVRGDDRPASADQRERLRVMEPDAVAYRRVRLRCGDRLLSEAENWYVPGRLTSAMNDRLQATTTPFGRVVEALEPYRQTFAVTMLWSPTADNPSSPTVSTPGAAKPLDIPAALFEHRAILFTRDRTPFAEVRESYQRDVLSFPPPP